MAEVIAPVPRFVPLRIEAVIDETADARSFVFAIPAEHRAEFAYAAGQYCTFEVEVDGVTHLRCYSMSSSPDVDEPFRTTVKRVMRRFVSNHFNGALAVGDTVLATPPTGRFTVDVDDDRPLVAFAAGAASPRSRRS
ncbi:MAG: FAD-binding oxidoreductase [Acidimicrobiales bacterium]